MFAEPLLSACVFLQLDMPFMPWGCVNVDSARRREPRTWQELGKTPGHRVI